jgi:para-nitrobenzyl esterase
VFHKSLFAEILVGLFAICSLARAEQSGPIVQTTAGSVEGIAKDGMVYYLGIPYAEPPVGKLRWRPAQPKQSWKGILDATHYQNHCIQFPLNKTVQVGAMNGASEDCLFLNIYARRAGISHNNRLRPVMVWIHGGANIIGASDYTDPAPLLETGDVIVVSMNYRLGAFGFMAHPALAAEGHPFANYGIMDQQLALSWVRDNIARFGGDPHNVTIFGLSAGGLNVTTHLVSPASAGLFHKAIIQSGAYLLDTPSLSYSEGLGTSLASRVGCARQTAAATAACLRALSVADILGHLNALQAEDQPPREDKFLRPGGAYPQMTVDGQILAEPIRVAIEAGHIHRIPVLLGSTSDEEREFTCGALDSLRSFSKWVPTFAYEFADRKATPEGAVHGADQNYLFNWGGLTGDLNHLSNFGGFRENPQATDGPFKLPPQSQALSEVIRQSWVAFATSGNPSTTRISKWPHPSEGIQRLDTTTLSVVSLKDFSIIHECGSESMSPDPS